MRTLQVDASWRDPIASDVLSAIQLRTGDNPLFPRLRVFECGGATEAFVPFIPLFLSSNTIDINIKFAANSPIAMVASTIVWLPILCPNIRALALNLPPRDPVITEAVSEMLVACNRDTLRVFLVNSPLTKEARGVLYKLPKLSQLWAVLQGATSLPPVTLPSLTAIGLEYDHGCNWLQGFRGATLGELRSVTFRAASGSTQIGNFLEEFQRVAVSTSTQNTLSRFAFQTLQSWNPNYSSLLIFKQLTKLEIEFSCHAGCSSRVDDDIVISLAQAMPKLEILQLGKEPCRTPTGVTLKGLVALARRCLHLSKLRIHLRVKELVEAATNIEPPYPPKHAAAIPRENCALTVLQVGETPIPEQAALAVAMTLLCIFPRMLGIEYANLQWKGVVETMKLFKRINIHVHHAGKAHLPHLQ